MTRPAMTIGDALDLALEWARQGVPAFPAAISWDEAKRKTNKRPLTRHGYLDATVDPDRLRSLFTQATPRAGETVGVGLHLGPAGIVALDIDGPDNLAHVDHLDLPATYTVTTQTGGQHRWYQKPAGVQHIGNTSPHPAIDCLRSDDGFVVAPGTRTPWGAWDTHDTYPDDLAELPDWLLDPTPSQAASRLLTRGDVDQLNPADRATLEQLLRRGWHTPRLRTEPGRGPWIELTRPGKQHGTSASIGYLAPGVLHVFTSSVAGLQAGGTYRWDPDRGDFIPWDDLSDWAADPGTPRAHPDVAPDGYPANDLGNAHRYADHATGRLHYVDEWGKHIAYQDGRWIVDPHGVRAHAIAAETATRLANTINPGDPAYRQLIRRVTSRTGIDAAIHCARHRLLITIDQLDRDPWALNLRNGTVDLRTGQLRPHHPDDLITRQAPVDYHPDATAPLWDACLERWQPNPAIRAYLQLEAGAAATGIPTDTTSIYWGQGANGKSCYLGTLQAVLGEYAAIIEKDLLIARRHEQHPTGRADLFGCRLAIATETSAGDRLDEESLKNLTGRDRLKARRMREDYWEFDPTHTLIMATNHKPRVRGTDEGIWRRLRLIPWEVIIPADERDPDLPAKLRAEAAGILNWIIEGARRFYEAGCRLTPPPQVVAATSAYRADQDLTAQFLAETIDPATSIIYSDELRAELEQWAAENSARITMHDVGARLKADGWVNERRREGSGARRTVWTRARRTTPATSQRLDEEEWEAYRAGEYADLF